MFNISILTPSGNVILCEEAEEATKGEVQSPEEASVRQAVIVRTEWAIFGGGFSAEVRYNNYISRPRTRGRTPTARAYLDWLHL